LRRRRQSFDESRLAYLLKYENMTLRAAYQYVKMARPIIRPNVGFWKQLIDYEKRLRGQNSVLMVPSRYGRDDVPDVYVDELRMLQHPLISNSTSSTTTQFGRPLTSRSTLQNEDSSRLANISISNGAKGSTVISSRSTQSSPLSTRLGSRYYRRGASFGGSTFPGSSGSGTTNSMALVGGSPLKHTNSRTNQRGNFFSSLYNSTADFMFPTF